jgi:predicted transcriptional regulator
LLCDSDDSVVHKPKTSVERRRKAKNHLSGLIVASIVDGLSGILKTSPPTLFATMPSSPLHLLADAADGSDLALQRVDMAQPGARAPLRRRWSDDARITWRGSNLLRVATVLHEMGQPSFMHVIATKSGLSPEETGKALSRLHQKGLLTREKKDDASGPRYFRWIMSDEQYDQYLQSAAMTPQDIDPDLRSIFAKMRLIEHLQNSTIFGNNPVLLSILDDYRGVWRKLNEREDQPRRRGQSS